MIQKKKRKKQYIIYGRFHEIFKDIPYGKLKSIV